MGGVGRDGRRVIDTFSEEWLGDICYLTYRHKNGCNMSFADGHTGSWKWKDIRTMRLIDGELFYLEDYSIDNQDINRLLPVIRGARDRQF